MFPTNSITEPENGSMETKYLAEEVIVHPLLILWRSVIGSLGVVILQSKKNLPTIHHLVLAIRFRAHPTNLWAFGGSWTEIKFGDPPEKERLEGPKMMGLGKGISESPFKHCNFWYLC